MKSSLLLAPALAVCAIFAASGCGELKKGKTTDPPPVIKIGGPAPKSAIDDKEAPGS